MNFMKACNSGEPSPARLRFRKILSTILIGSVIFAIIPFGVIVARKTDLIDWRDMTHGYLYLNSNVHLARAAMETDDEKRFERAQYLVRQGVFTPYYLSAGKSLVEEMAEEGHPPAQYLHALLIINRKPVRENNLRSSQMMHRAAAKGYQPAVDYIAQVHHAALMRSQTPACQAEGLPAFC